MRRTVIATTTLLLASCGGGSPTKASDGSTDGDPPVEEPCEAPSGITFARYSATTCLGLDIYLPTEGSGPYPGLGVHLWKRLAQGKPRTALPASTLSSVQGVRGSHD